MEKKGVLSTIKFMLCAIIFLVLVFSAVAVTIMNLYKPTLRVSLGDKFIGYFSDRQQFEEVYDTLVSEKQQIDSNVKVYLDEQPKFEETYIRDVLIASQNVYTALRAEINTEFTIYNVAVNNEEKMTFNDKEEADKYASNLKKEVSKLNVEVTSKKVSELGEMTSMDRADSILKDIVSRNKPVYIPPVYNYYKAPVVRYNSAVPAEIASLASSQSGVWPTDSRSISSWFGYRSGEYHTGTDIAGKYGMPIYAYKTGVVTFSGWDATGYGNLIKIDHGNGMVTYYAHNSRLLVSAGQTVSMGQTIALMGSTGYSSGNHCHFEVRLNSVPQNSYKYLTAL